MEYNSIKQNNNILDNNGDHIQAHGGSIIKVDDTYFWYGENKSNIYGRKEDGKPFEYWHHGVNYYSSKDLYNWKFEGQLIKESNDPANPFYSKNIMDRPHIIFNKKNSEFILWAKCAFNNNFEGCVFAICRGKSLDRLEYKYYVDPSHHQAGDFDLFEINNKGYIVYNCSDGCVILEELNDNYDGLTGKYSIHIQMPYAPYCREAPCFFAHNNKLFLLTSGTTGYFPNFSLVYDITNLHGEWKQVCNPCINDINNDSFHSQFSSVLYIPENNLYIAIGDNWLIDFNSTKYDIYEIFKHNYSNGVEKGHELTHEEFLDMSRQELFKADYLWLPIEFDANENPRIRFIEEWRIQK